MKKVIIGIIIGVVIIIIALAAWYFLIKDKTQTNQNSTTPSATSQKWSGNFIDTHAHLTANGTTLDEVVSYLDKYKIEKIIVMQTPVNIYANMTPEQFMIPEAAQKRPDRFAVMYEGEAISLLTSVAGNNSYTPNQEEQFIRLVRDAAASGQYIGFGEIALRHYPQPSAVNKQGLDITNPGDHPWLLALSDIAAEYNMPLDIHIEPDGNTLPGFETLISHNPKTKIIFDHAGWYNTGEATPDLFRSLMKKYPNLYSSIKLRKAQSDAQKKVSILDDNQKIKTEWLNLFKEFPDRFTIGTDTKFGLGTNEGDADQHLAVVNTFLTQLPDELAQKIALNNAKTIFGF